ncbi:DUF6603 domain-containing protein [Cellulomonas alba]|uniref:DUF6603 domain-containing protein n=1 Tax=Cellulomonas alba TaxID=3053467 RepID=A0ABT7SCH8_9CELL|nr:DUF6603 domain-containing protein [Cellulomonas alba]MDM7853880.1 hypothetical protein [Cellulomonas alba]
MSAAGTLAPVIKATAAAAAGLGELLGDVEDFGDLLAAVGCALGPGVELDLQLLEPKLGSLRDALGSLATASGGLDPEADDEELVGQLAVVATAFAAVTAAVAALATTPLPGGLPEPLDDPQTWVAIAERGLGFVVRAQLAERAPQALAILELLGVADPGDFDDTGAVVTRPATLHWDLVPRLLSDPVGVLGDAYGWGDLLDQRRLLQTIAGLAHAFGLSPAADGRDAILQMFWTPPAAGSDSLDVGAVTLPLVTLDASSAVPVQSVVELVAFGVPGAAGGPDVRGLGLGVVADAALSTSIALADAVSLAIAGDVQAGVGLALTPDGVSFGSAGGGAAAGGSLTLTLTARPQPAWAFGDPQGTRFETSRLEISVTAKAAVSSAHGVEDPSVVVRVEGDFAVNLDLSSGDGFVTTLLGDEPQRMAFTAGVEWSSATGLRFLGGPAGGGAGAPLLATTLPLDLDVAGVLHLSSLALEAGAAGQGAALRALASGGLDLGPVHVVFRRIGVALQIAAPPDGTGNLGPLDVSLGLAGPEALGLSIDAAAISGGGYLEIDTVHGRYVGIAQLTLVDVVSVTAIGIVTTQMPDGSPGFSLLLLITAQGFTPVQLGMGFALTGIGGLVALNRTVDADKVRGGLSDGILDSVLFVQDPVANADRVITTLDSIFPIARDRLVVGPLAEISWGTPAIVKLRLAVLLDLPMPIRAVILAALSVTLPDPETPAVELHVDAIGVLDLGRSQLALDASLHDSRVLSFTLTGDLALRLDWGQNPGFLLSAGGFHPRFTPPAGLRPLRRLALQLTSGKNPQVRFEAYLAVTSNTLQMGAKASVALDVGGFSITGGGSFDALLQWSPFHLEVDLAAWVKISAGGTTLLSLSLALTVTGPAPWHLTGTASFSILFLSASVSVDLTLGSSAAATTPVAAVDVGGLLWDAVSPASAWEAVLPAAVSPGAVLAIGPVSAGRVVAHPLATVSVRQKVAPLGVAVSHVGAHLTTNGTETYALTLTGPAGTTSRPLTDLFARSQYATVADEQKLAAPSFEPFTSGVELAPEHATSSGPSVPCLAVVDTLDVTALDSPPVSGQPAPALVPVAGGGA